MRLVMVSLRVQLLLLHLVFYAGFALMRNWFLPVPPLQALILAVLLVWVSVVDVERMEVPDTAAFLLALTGGIFADQSIDHLLAGILWPALFYAVGTGYARLRGWQGLGFGDVKLMAGIGLWLGLHATTLVVFAASFAGIVAIVASKLAKGRVLSDIGTSAVAFGPFLCLSAWVIWLFKGPL